MMINDDLWWFLVFGQFGAADVVPMFKPSSLWTYQILGLQKQIWLVVYLPLWKMMEFASWDDDIPNMMGKS
jgi:hypothetical protein